MRRSGSMWSLSTQMISVSLAIVTLVSGASAASTEKIVHAFTSVADGMEPSGNLTPQAGGLFGTTFLGGSGTQCTTQYGCGTVFELQRSGNTWVKTTIYSFQGGTDGWYPNGGLVSDRAGNLYGTTYFGDRTIWGRSSS